MAKINNPFDQFKQRDTFKAKIKSLDYEITYRKLSAAEEDEFNIRLIKGVDRSKEEINYEEGIKVKYEKIAKQLIDPKVTVAELRNAPSEVISELSEVLSEKDMLDDEGNSES